MRDTTLRREAAKPNRAVETMRSGTRSAFDKAKEVASGAGVDTSIAGRSRARQAQTVVTIVVIAVIAMVGTLIVANVGQAMPEINDSSPLSGTVDTLLQGFNDSIGFVPIVMLVLLASLVIAVVQRMR